MDGERTDTRGIQRPKRPLAPEAALALVEKLRAARVAAQARRATLTETETSALLNDPLGHLSRFKRAEWEVVARWLADPEVTARELARRLGYHNRRSVEQILQKPHVKAFIAQVRAKQVEAIIRGDFGAQALLKQSQVDAAKHVVGTIADEQAPKKVRLQAAESVLDRTGLGKATAVQHHHVHEILRHFTADELDRYGKTGEAPARFAEVFKQLEGSQE